MKKRVTIIGKENPDYNQNHERDINILIKIFMNVTMKIFMNIVMEMSNIYVYCDGNIHEHCNANIYVGETSFFKGYDSRPGAWRGVDFLFKRRLEPMLH